MEKSNAENQCSSDPFIPDLFVIYIHGRSRSCFEAQREAISSYIRHEDGVILSWYIEMESGKKGIDGRPKLAAALEHCRATGATLIIARLDRLARDAHFLRDLQHFCVPFICADMPHEDQPTVETMALVAEKERLAISRRTRAALAAARAKRKSGCSNRAPHLRNAVAVMAVKKKARKRAGIIGNHGRNPD